MLYKNSVQRSIPCCSGKKEALLDDVCVRCVGMCNVWVWRCAVLCCVVGCVCVCRTLSQDHGVHIHKDVHVGVALFALSPSTMVSWFHGFLLLAAVSRTFRDFNPYKIYKRCVA